MANVSDLLANPSTAEEALRVLRARCDARPDDPRPLLELASAYDFLDREPEAAALYRRVETLGLEHLARADRVRWHVQLGSTLRLLGQLDASREVLNRGRAAFPESQAILAFLALTELASGRAAHAAHALLTGLVRSTDPEVEYYRRALTAYIDGVSPGT